MCIIYPNIILLSATSFIAFTLPFLRSIDLAAPFMPLVFFPNAFFIFRGHLSDSLTRVTDMKREMCAC